VQEATAMDELEEASIAGSCFPLETLLIVVGNFEVGCLMD